MKTTRRPGDTLTCTETAICAAPDCQAEFTKRPGARHQIYCSRRCRDHVAKVNTATREAAVPKGAKPLRMKAEHLGGTVQGGAMVSGTAILGKRPEYDLDNLPDDGRFW